MKCQPALSAIRILLAGFALSAPIWAGGAVVQAPSYTAAGIVSAASYSAAALAPNAITALFGTNLSFTTASLTPQDVSNGEIPTTLGGVTVYIDGLAAALFYVSPVQINFLIPNSFAPNTVTVSVAREGVAGPAVTVTLNAAGPALFQDANYNAIATHLDGSLITSAAPAQPGEWAVLYGTGLGRTIPDASNYSPAASPAPIQDMASFSVLLDSVAVDPSAINYAGLVQGFAGLYQVNLKLPAGVSPNPTIQLAVGTAVSVPGVLLQVN